MVANFSDYFSDTTPTPDHRCLESYEKVNDADVGVSRQNSSILRGPSPPLRSSSSPSLTDYIRQHLIEFGFTSEFDNNESYFTAPTTLVKKSTTVEKSKPAWLIKTTMPHFFIGDAVENDRTEEVDEETHYSLLDGGTFGNIVITTGS